MDIYAKSEIHVLLFEGKIKVIGAITEGIKFDNQGKLITIKKMELHYGTSYADVFYFENDHLAYSDLSLHTANFIIEIYKRLISNGKTSSNQFIEGLLEIYVFKEMGF